MLDQIDPDGYISHSLYRQHATLQDSIFIKDLSRIGRRLSKTIIVDNLAENFQRQTENGIFIKSWFDNYDDTALEELSLILKRIAQKKNTDVRVTLSKLKKLMMKQILKGKSISKIAERI